MMPTPRAVNRVPSSRILFMRSGDDQIRHHRKMVAGPNPVDGLSKCQLTGGDPQRGAAPLSTSNEDVVNPLKWPIPVRLPHQGVPRGEGMPETCGLFAVPGIAITDAETSERLLPREETKAGGIRLRIEITGKEDVRRVLSVHLLQGARRNHGLTLPFQLIIREVIDHQQRTERWGSVDLGNQRRAGNCSVRALTTFRSSSRTLTIGHRLPMEMPSPFAS